MYPGPVSVETQLTVSDSAVALTRSRSLSGSREKREKIFSPLLSFLLSISQHELRTIRLTEAPSHTASNLATLEIRWWFPLSDSCQCEDIPGEAEQMMVGGVRPRDPAEAVPAALVVSPSAAGDPRALKCLAQHVTLETYHFSLTSSLVQPHASWLICRSQKDGWYLFLFPARLDHQASSKAQLMKLVHS